jgi:tetratricopeptide (TPR) repeat protein
MIARLIILIVVLLGPFLTGGSRDGRRGNAHYEQNRYAEAAEAFRAGLFARDRAGSDRMHHGLLNNLGMTLHRMGIYDEAHAAFRDAIEAAGAPSEISRAAYNAGNNAYAVGDLESALDLFRAALLANPENELAKYNYELVKRRLDEQQPSPGRTDGDISQDQDQEGEVDGQKEEDGDSARDEQEGASQDPSSLEEDGGLEDQPSQEPITSQLSREQAEQLLQALERDEQQLLRQVHRQNERPRQVEKDW